MWKRQTDQCYPTFQSRHEKTQLQHCIILVLTARTLCEPYILVCFWNPVSVAAITPFFHIKNTRKLRRPKLSGDLQCSPILSNILVTGIKSFWIIHVPSLKNISEMIFHRIREAKTSCSYKNNIRQTTFSSYASTYKQYVTEVTAHILGIWNSIIQKRRNAKLWSMKCNKAIIV
jgi:hypothetical protein